MDQTPQTVAHITAQERALDKAITDGPGHWLTDLLTRASRDDAPGPSHPPLIHDESKLIHEETNMSRSALPEEQMVLVESARDQIPHKVAASLNRLDDLQRNLSKAVDGKRNHNFQNSRPDLHAALDLVEKAAQALDLMEKRATAIEAYALKVVQRSRDELAEALARASTCEERVRATEQVARELQTQLSASEERALRAEERARRVEEEVKNAEAWMVHVHDVIVHSLSGAISVFRKLSREGDVTVELENKLKGSSSEAAGV